MEERKAAKIHLRTKEKEKDQFQAGEKHLKSKGRKEFNWKQKKNKRKSKENKRKGKEKFKIGVKIQFNCKQENNRRRGKAN